MSLQVWWRAVRWVLCLSSWLLTSFSLASQCIVLCWLVKHAVIWVIYIPNDFSECHLVANWYRLLSVSMRCKLFWRHLFRINLSFVVTLQFSLWGKHGICCSGFWCRILIVLFWLAEMFGWLAAQNLVLKTRNPLLPHTAHHTQNSWWSLIPGRGGKITVKQQLSGDN